ncbi:MAG: PIG-L family deacetylase [Planctomycetes bacterium]|nr:PIG-L family deacetylase [Planctomycetota bacterium]
MKMRLAIAFTVLLAATPAQGPEPTAGLVALHQACLDASTDAVVLNVAAHPDDEASRTRMMLRRRHGARVVTAYATYGDGGQNAIGREIGHELAHLRVRETLRAAAMSDVEVRWLGMEDFGFSKTLDETLSMWGRDRLRDAMRAVIAEVKPDLIITNHDIGRGHGHHRACAWAVLEVLRERAANGEAVPPMLGRCGPDDAWVTVDPGELDPARGETFAKLAHDAWVQHATQGPWGPHDPMHVSKEWWQLVFPEGRERKPVDGFAAWLPQCGREELARGAEAWSREQLHREVRRRLGSCDRSGREFAALSRALMALADVRVEAGLASEFVPLGGEGKVSVIVHGHERVAALDVSCEGVAATPVNAPVRIRIFELPDQVADPAKPPAVMPGRYTVGFEPHPDAGGSIPAGPEPSTVTVEVTFELEGMPIRVPCRLFYTMVPPVEVRLDRDVIMVPEGKAVERTFSASVKSWRGEEPTAAVVLGMGPGIGAAATPGRLRLTKDHDEARLLVRATIDPAELTADASINVGYGESRARVRVKPVAVTVPEGLRLGLVRGPDDTTELALADLGIAVTLLDRDSLMMEQLEHFDTLLLDIRANFHRPDLAEMRDRILQFCRGGGRVVVMYHKPGEWNVKDPQHSLLPFPLTVGRDRVTEESAPVKLLHPEHRLMQYPHRIGTADFDGWVQERGLNFPSRWDEAWTALLEMKDSGEGEPLQGALLYTRYGRGDYVYCSLALYRQLRVGNVGAARILVNLLAR